MKRRINVTISAGLLAATALGLWLYARADAHEAATYRFATIERGNLQASVSATGTLGALQTVVVGTQVSGQVAAINVDFNSHVKKGQLIARIDPTLQQQAVEEAQAGLAKAQAQLNQAKEEYDRETTLHDKDIVTETEYQTAVATYAVARASLTSAQIALDKARQNLAYTNIYSPIDGVVVERAVDVGQTVAASLAAPKLFVIANDLRRMQILALVDESDIGLIKAGLPVTFTVQSYRGVSFDGIVRQVRLNSTTEYNVVSYTAVIDVGNPDRLLLPGMTATVKFITGSASNVLSVPNLALRFSPAGQSAKGATIYTVDAKGALVAHEVMPGLSDGQRTQVTAPDLKAGMQVVIGANSSDSGDAAPNATTNPLQQSQEPQQPQGPSGPPGFGG
ncbi:MAG: efflux RND transporter periplasmic adaptor subunit [Gemmatimonadaceae bacterium]